MASEKRCLISFSGTTSETDFNFSARTDTTNCATFSNYLSVDIEFRVGVVEDALYNLGPIFSFLFSNLLSTFPFENYSLLPVVKMLWLDVAKINCFLKKSSFLRQTFS
ncbi:hypothetical protein ABEB36_011056 [Hypothenemus hampei]|uniref:Uncharacterized protein n=1 Tax=Hypothenemus hampei TaxID=57062 RepID=A0ABD1EE05_HYPHA